MFKNVLADVVCDGIAAWDPGCLGWGGALKLLLPRGPETVFKSGVTYASLDAEQREMLDDYLQYRAADVAVEMREKKAAGKIGIFPPRGWWTHRPLEQHRAAVHAWKAWIEMK